MEDYKEWVVCGEAFRISLRTMKGAEKEKAFDSTALSLTEVARLLSQSHQRLPKRFTTLFVWNTLILLAVLSIKIAFLPPLAWLVNQFIVTVIQLFHPYSCKSVLFSHYVRSRLLRQA